MDNPNAAVAAARSALEQRSFWYHTIELAPGVVTPGSVDLRGAARKLLPSDLRGRRALDVGAFDGFWSFEMERRGASVTAFDLGSFEDADWPPFSRMSLPEPGELHRGFELAASCLGSSVSRVEGNVYNLTPELVGGPVDFAFSGALLLHLRDPVRALERVWDSLTPGGTVVVMEPISVPLTLRSPRRAAAEFVAHTSDTNWWLPNAACISRWLRASRFTRIRRLSITRPPTRDRKRRFYAGYSAIRPA